MKNVIAVDVGFGRVKALFAGQRLEYPSVIAPWQQPRFSNDISRNSPVDHLAIEYIGRKMFLGKMAFRQSKARVNLSMERFCSTEGMALLLTTIALLLPDKSVTCSLVTGLPVNVYPGLKEKYEKILLGQHYIKLIAANGEQEERYITIGRCKILPQPMGTVFNEILGGKGELENRELASSRFAVMDIGQNTLDLCCVDSLEYVNLESTSFSDLGVFECYKQLSAEIYNAFSIEIPPEEIEQHIRGNEIKIGVHSRSIVDIKRRSYLDAAEKIVSRVGNVWRNMWQFNRIIVTGGGAQVLGENIVEALKSPCPVEICKQGTFSNVMGYFKFGGRTWSK